MDFCSWRGLGLGAFTEPLLRKVRDGLQMPPWFVLPRRRSTSVHSLVTLKRASYNHSIPSVSKLVSAVGSYNYIEKDSVHLDTPFDPVFSTSELFSHLPFERLPPGFLKDAAVVAVRRPHIQEQ